MKKITISLNQTMPSEKQRQQLAAVYAFILSWTKPISKETASSEYIGEETEPAEEKTADNAGAS